MSDPTVPVGTTVTGSYQLETCTEVLVLTRSIHSRVSLVRDTELFGMFWKTPESPEGREGTSSLSTNHRKCGWGSTTDVSSSSPDGSYG